MKAHRRPTAGASERRSPHHLQIGRCEEPRRHHRPCAAHIWVAVSFGQEHKPESRRGKHLRRVKPAYLWLGGVHINPNRLHTSEAQEAVSGIFVEAVRCYRPCSMHARCTKARNASRQQQHDRRSKLGYLILGHCQSARGASSADWPAHGKPAGDRQGPPHRGVQRAPGDWTM